MTRLKGPLFPSYLNQETPKPKMQWRRHCGTRQQLRGLRNRLRPILESKDPEIVMTGQRVIESVAYEPNPVFGALHLMCAGLDASEESGATWVVAMNYLLDKFDAMGRPQEEATA